MLKETRLGYMYNKLDYKKLRRYKLSEAGLVWW